MELNPKLTAEQNFHDEWAKLDSEKMIDVNHVNQAATSPELRFIHKHLGNIEGKGVLDIGCGHGEVAVYFAKNGAKVTAIDLSINMIANTNELAKRNCVKVETIHSSIENFVNKDNIAKFDVIYFGNILHHINIETAIKLVSNHLSEEGKVIAWEPLAYNPVIKLYRWISPNVRTKDERPLDYKAVSTFTNAFEFYQIHFFWFTTLIIFALMFFVKFKNPNKIRFWKQVVDDSKEWEKIFYPLEKVDRFILSAIPNLGWLCWNVVIVCQKPKKLTIADN